MGVAPDLDLIRRLEAHAVDAWPATITQAAPGGWLLRATPGLDRGRSNHALTPFREIEPHEIEPALQHIQAFAQTHGIRTGIQVSPQELHGRLERELDERGWKAQWPTLVLAAAPQNQPRPRPELELDDHATPQWLASWARCEGRHDVAAHAKTVFALLGGKAKFARLGDDAVGVSVTSDGLVGLFCLAVAPERRRQGLGTALVRALLAHAPGEIAYLQVEERNVSARATYAQLGFVEVYRYRHRIAPPARW